MSIPKATVVLLVVIASVLFSKSNKEFVYIHPGPSSENVNPAVTIILKADPDNYRKEILHNTTFTVTGERSGNHTGRKIVSGNTVTFKTDVPFAENEKVNVAVNTRAGSTEYFFTTGGKVYFDRGLAEKYLWQDETEGEVPDNRQGKSIRVINGVSVPSDFPEIEVAVNKGGTAEGKIFMNNWGGSPYIMILENDGTPYFYQKMKERARDFKVQPNGVLTRRIKEGVDAFVTMDSSYTVTDTLACVNGYGTDEHELYMTEEGHYFLIGLGYRKVDMSKVVSGGNPNATVVDNHVQEFDENGNLVFEWLGQDHFNVEDAVYEYLQSDWIDYIHMNSIAVDYDGNIITSSRHQDEVTKIDRNTGEVIWRLGGRNSDFEFINDSYGISYQHFAQPVKGKPDTYLIFDNGNFHGPKFSRAVEFELDTEAGTATKVWEFDNNKQWYTWWMGNAQRMENGNTFINYADASLPKAVEVTPSGEIVYRADFKDSYNCYRAFRYEWESVTEKPYLLAESFPDKVSLIFNKFGDKDVKKYIIYSGFNDRSLTPFDTVSGTNVSYTDLENNRRYYFRVTAVNSDGDESLESNTVSVAVKYVPAGTNMLVNGDFTSGQAGWNFNFYSGASGSGEVNGEGEFFIDIESGGPEVWNVQLTQNNVPVINGRTYVFEFDAKASFPRTIDAKLETNGDPYTNYSKTGTFVLERSFKHFKKTFTMEEVTDYSARVVFNCGYYGGSVTIDNVSVSEYATSVEEETNKPGEYRLYNNYPNPFNPVTTIKFYLPEAGKVALEVYNLPGEKVVTLVDGEMSMGYHEVNFSGKDLSSGVYVARMKTKGYTSAIKLVLLK